MPTKKEKKDNSEKKYKLAKIGIVVITILFIFIIYKIFSMVVLKNEKIDLSGEYYYQYFYGIRQEYSGNMDLVRNNDTTQLILEDNKVVYLDSTPIYYRDVLGKVLFPSKMAVVYPRSGTLLKIDEFSNIINENNTMYVKKLKKDKTTDLNSVFLYDGSDLYFFLEEMTVKIGKEKYKVSPLSYVIVNYRQNIEIYDYDKDEYTIIPEDIASSVDVTATNKYNDYTINLSVDSFTTGSSDQLLIKNIDYLTELDY